MLSSADCDYQNTFFQNFYFKIQYVCAVRMRKLEVVETHLTHIKNSDVTWYSIIA